MSTARPEVLTEELPRSRPDWIALATSPDHKVVGRLYVSTSLLFAALAATELVLMRIQLLVPDFTFMRPEIFDRLLSAYGVTALVFFALPLALGLFSYVVPLQIGARGAALPRLGQLSWWLYVFGGVTVYASFLYTPSEAGTTALPPLASAPFSPGNGVDAWLAGTGLATLGFVLFAVNIVATIHRHRAPGVAWRRMPLFSWAAAGSGYMLLVIGPVLLAAVTMLLIDRHFDGIFFNANEGGSPLLYEHLSWIYFTGAYFIVIIAASGAISEIVATFSRKPHFGHRAMAASLAALAVLGPLAWMQNMYASPVALGFKYGAMAIALALVVPLGLLIFNWIATLWNGSISTRSPMVFALGSIGLLAIGTAGELAQSLIPVNGQIADTATAWGDTHYALIGAGVFGGLAAVYYWFPKLTGRLAGEGLARLSFWAMLAGAIVMVVPIQLAGLEGQPVDVYKFFGGEGVSAYNLIGSIGAFIFVDGLIGSLVNLAYSARNGVVAGPDPWRGTTLEWFAPSPPPEHNFDLVPDVRGPEPMRDIREAVREGRAAGQG